jgi:hypothetical protein
MNAAFYLLIAACLLGAFIPYFHRQDQDHKETTMTDIHSAKFAVPRHIPKQDREAAVRLVETQPDADQLKEMLGLG